MNASTKSNKKHIKLQIFIVFTVAIITAIFAGIIFYPELDTAFRHIFAATAITNQKHVFWTIFIMTFVSGFIMVMDLTNYQTKTETTEPLNELVEQLQMINNDELLKIHPILFNEIVDVIRQIQKTSHEMPEAYSDSITKAAIEKLNVYLIIHQDKKTKTEVCDKNKIETINSLQALLVYYRDILSKIEHKKESK